MPLYASDSAGQIIFCQQAQKQQDYYCQECGETVRLRVGDNLRPHFYHIKERLLCNLSGKSLAHMENQRIIWELFPPNDIELEKKIGARRADIVWEKEKMVMEVQISPISKQEVESRFRDYAAQGYKLLWLLHDSRYNHMKLTAAERYLHPFPHYFTNIDAKGKGFIYDQISFIEDGMRKERLKKRPIRLTHLLKEPLTIPDMLKPHRPPRPFLFQGDTLYTGLREEEEERVKKWVFTPENTSLGWKYYLKMVWVYLLRKGCG